MFEYESVAKNVEKAIAQGLSELQLERDDVDIKILETGGFFKKAKVVLIVPEEIAKTNEAVIRLRKLEDLEKKAEEEIENSQIQINNEIKNTEIANQRDFGTKKEKQQEQTQEKKVQKKEFVTADEGISETKTFLENLLKSKYPEVTISQTIDGNYLNFDVKVDNASRLLGFGAKGLSSLQFLANIYIGKFSRHAKKVNIDINDYKTKRKQTVETLAKRLCERVLETGASLELEPMTAYERRVVHSVVQSFEGLTSYSEGKEPARHITILPKQKTREQENQKQTQEQIVVQAQKQEVVQAQKQVLTEEEKKEQEGI